MSAISEAREIYNKWVVNGKQSQAQPVAPVVQKAVPVEKVWPSLEKPSSVSKRTKIEHKKLVRKAVSRNPENPTSPIKKIELEKTKVFWDSIPSNQEPIVRGLSNFLGIDPNLITSNRAEALKEIIEKAVSAVGSDEREIFKWVQKKLQQGGISGERKEAQLRIFLRM